MPERRRFGINPGPLRLRGPIPKPDYNAGRCVQITQEGWRCSRDAVIGDYCRQHAKGRVDPATSREERTDAPD